MIAIRDRYGRLCGFAGRSLDGQPPKYKNSRETLWFQKSRFLYGFDRAAAAARLSGQPILIVEGYFDVLALWRAGIEEACAVMGTALTIDHLRMISEVTRSVVLVFDGDQAGERASLATVKTAMEFPDLNVRVCRLPIGLDPDECI